MTFKGLFMKSMLPTKSERLITDEKVRPDGRRKLTKFRPLDCQIDLLPRVHGSALLYQEDKRKFYQVVTL